MNSAAFPKATASTFDSFAIDAGTRVEIFSEPNFQGTLLLEQSGPAMVWNQQFAQGCACFPTAAPDGWSLEMSTTDMHNWPKGSMKIWAGAAVPDKPKKLNAFGLYDSSGESSGSWESWSETDSDDDDYGRVDDEPRAGG